MPPVERNPMKKVITNDALQQKLLCFLSLLQMMTSVREPQASKSAYTSHYFHTHSYHIPLN